MINRMRVGTPLITDFSVGGVARTLVEAPAQEIDELYQQMVAGLVEAVPVSVYRSFSFTRLSAQAAGGLVRVSITPQAVLEVIPAGVTLTQLASSVVYAVVSDRTIPAGASYVDVPVQSATAGSASNLAVNTAFTLSQPPLGWISASNLVAFIDGSDDETADQQKTRFNHYIATVARGTLAALRYGAVDKAFLLDASGNVVERVAFVGIDEPYVADPLQPVGLVHMYAHNGTGATSPALIAQIVRIIYGYYDQTGVAVPGYKAAGVMVTVQAASELPVPVVATLTAMAGYLKPSLVLAVGNTIAAYLLGLDIGAPAIVAKMVELAMEVPGVFNFVPAAGTADTLSNVSTKLMPGVIAIA